MKRAYLCQYGDCEDYTGCVYIRYSGTRVYFCGPRHAAIWLLRQVDADPDVRMAIALIKRDAQ